MLKEGEPVTGGAARCTFFTIQNWLHKSEQGFLEVFALLGRYAALIGSQLPTLRDSLSVPPSSVKQSKKKQKKKVHSSLI